MYIVHFDVDSKTAETTPILSEWMKRYQERALARHQAEQNHGRQPMEVYKTFAHFREKNMPHRNRVFSR